MHYNIMKHNKITRMFKMLQCVSRMLPDVLFLNNLEYSTFTNIYMHYQMSAVSGVSPEQPTADDQSARGFLPGEDTQTDVLSA